MIRQRAGERILLQQRIHCLFIQKRALSLLKNELCTGISGGCCRSCSNSARGNCRGFGCSSIPSHLCGKRSTMHGTNNTAAGSRRIHRCLQIAGRCCW